MSDATINIKDIRKRLETKKGQAYWRSLDELAETKDFNEFMTKEFPQHAGPLASSIDRRDFLRLLGASLALAGLSSCVRPVSPHEKIVPYVKGPEQIIPGKPLFFATAITQGGYALGLLAENHQGRPTKVEGNPDHPASLGATDSITQASVLSLYDPDRSQTIINEGETASWQDLSSTLTSALSNLNNGKGLAILTENVTSPTLAKQLSDILSAYPQAKWHQYDVMHSDAALGGAQAAFGEAVHTLYDFSKADVILSFDADFLGSGPAKLSYSKAFSRRRKVLNGNDDMNRLYLAETGPSITSAVADHRLPLRPSQILNFASTVAHELGVDVPALDNEVDSHLIEVLVSDLKAHQGSCIVIAGDEQPAELHALVHAINQELGNVGKTVIYTEPVEANPINHLASLEDLSKDIKDSNVEVLLILGGNPAYTAPVTLGIASAIESVPLSIHLGLYQDETAALCTWHVPKTHYLETWSDAKAFDGSTSIMQPLIAPFYGGKSEHELLDLLLANERSNYDIVKGYWQEQVEGDFDTFWQQSVYAGVIANSQTPSKNVTLTNNLPELASDSEGYELVFRLDPSILDGRYANNGWLQELPKPITKLTWDNAALMSPVDAEELNVSNGDLIDLSANGVNIKAPVWVLPGQAQKTITVHLGFGRPQAGRVGSNIGFDAYPLRSLEKPWFTSAEVSKSSGRHKLISTQVHHTYEGTTEKRHIIRHGTLAEFKKDPEHPHFVHPVAHAKSDIYPDFEYNSYAWGMVIDMNVCTGCNACVTACQSENNIPIVGKKQVEMGREMHWIRVDTYYGGDLDNPQLYTQPVGCMHCEKAPCEPVCPVGATVHDNEGLNVMVYNRCVGTRYCSNNCPYKVRRYNFLQFAELTTTATELSLAQNPDVTVRSRGVMEKCTYCIQRIQEAYIKTENEGRKIKDGDVVTACQSACPSEAIVFGDINDPESQVSNAKASPLNYYLLEELNTKPRTSYISKLTNPHPDLASESEGH